MEVENSNLADLYVTSSLPSWGAIVHSALVQASGRVCCETDWPAHQETAPGAAAGRVLLLDDEDAILLPTAAYLRSLGFAVEMAREHEEAEALVAHRSYDVAILDLRVSTFEGSQGLNVLREIRRRGRRTRVIVLSAYVSPEAEAEARSLGADAVVCKPVRLADLGQLAFVSSAASLG